MSLHVLATTASSVHAAHDLELAFDLKWTSRMGVLVIVLKTMARCVASLSAICGLAVTWFFGSVCALTMSRLVMRSIISEFSACTVVLMPSARVCSVMSSISPSGWIGHVQLYVGNAFALDHDG
jgi:hypothetical protein